jgi:hypothetical protein
VSLSMSAMESQAFVLPPPAGPKQQILSRLRLLGGCSGSNSYPFSLIVHRS